LINESKHNIIIELEIGKWININEAKRDHRHFKDFFKYLSGYIKPEEYKKYSPYKTLLISNYDNDLRNYDKWIQIDSKEIILNESKRIITYTLQPNIAFLISSGSSDYNISSIYESITIKMLNDNYLYNKDKSNNSNIYDIIKLSPKKGIIQNFFKLHTKSYNCCIMPSPTKGNIYSFTVK